MNIQCIQNKSGQDTLNTFVHRTSDTTSVKCMPT